MGNVSEKELIKRHPSLFYEKLLKSSYGQKVYSCSYEKWMCGTASMYGFNDNVDYSSGREDFRSKGMLLRPDVTHGRYIQVNRVTNGRICIEERLTNTKVTINIPPCQNSGKIPQKLRFDYRRLVLNYVQQQHMKDGVAVIGCLGNLAVIQFLDRKECYVPEFYFLDLARLKCLGKFYTKDCELLWYECYISPDKSRILLRPDVNTHSWTASDTLKVHSVDTLQVITMHKFADCGGHALAFDNRHGNRYLFRAKDKEVQLFDFKTLEVVQSSKQLPVPAPIRQLKSSPSGQFLAARCVAPVYSMEYQTNLVVVLNAASLEQLFQLDARGPYWAITEPVNLQVFPRFSSCDSSVAVMKNGTSKRKITIYKLPVLLTTLQHSCRKVIRRCIHLNDLNKLSLPSSIVRYLRLCGLLIVASGNVDIATEQNLLDRE